jgi:hypothetical protein
MSITNKEAVESVRLGNYYNFNQYKAKAHLISDRPSKTKKTGKMISDRERVARHQKENKRLYSKPPRR